MWATGVAGLVPFVVVEPGCLVLGVYAGLVCACVEGSVIGTLWQVCQWNPHCVQSTVCPVGLIMCHQHPPPWSCWL